MEVVETDLGAFIVQLTGDDPYHIIAPALHLTLEQVRELFSRESGEELPAEPDVLAAYARRRLREKFLTAELGISGGNFGIASTGTVVLVTNEGNGRMSTTLPGTHVAVMGMERLLPDWESLDTALTLLTRAGTSQRISTYVSAISGPRRDGDRDGPDELHVVLLDNGRSRILGTQYEPVLKCVRCGACLDHCPVYGCIGGHAYSRVYTGPIGAVLTPLLDGLDEHVELPYASSLCGACVDACPARVPLTDLLLALRAEAVSSGRQPQSWRAGMRGYAEVTARPAVWDAAVRIAGALARPFAPGGYVRSAPGLLGKWTAARDLKVPVARSFRRRRRESGGGGGADVDRERYHRPHRGASRAPAAAGPCRRCRAARRRRGRAPDREALLTLLLRAAGRGRPARPSSSASRAEAQAAVERLVAERGYTALDCPAALRWPGIEALCTGDPRAADFGLSEARWAIAETGTVVLWHDPAHPRASSLVPPAAGVFVPASGLVPRLGDITARLAEAERRDLPACVTFMTGPSRSMDIGYVSCMGVHGPGEVVVWVIADE